MVANGIDSAISSSATLTVTAATGMPTSAAPLITTQPVSQTVTVGQSATFNVGATGTSPMTYQWTKNGNPVSGATSSSYTTQSETTADNNAQFSVMVTNGIGSAISSSAILTVTAATATPTSAAPSITTQPVSQTVTVGQSATFNVGATGSAPMTYQWMENGNPVSGATSSSYTTPSETTADNNAQFSVMVANDIGSAISTSAILTVTTATGTPTSAAPSITTQPVSQTVTVGQSATFNVAATGISPMTYQWMENGNPVSGATSSSYTTPSETTADNNAQFAVMVANGIGSAISSSATLTVTAATGTPTSAAPSITTQPVSQTVTVGQSATFNVGATGSTPMTYQWMENGNPVSGATSSSYTTPSETTADNNAQFSVMVANGIGSTISTSAILTVTAATGTPTSAAPSITTQPASQTVTVGQSATFSVAATGTAPMTYQWMKNGTPISGATSSSYTTPSETTADNNAQFSVMVANGIGSAISSSATLTVTAGTGTGAVALSISPTSASVSASGMQSFTATVTGTSNTAVTWSLSGAGCSGSTCGTLSTSALSAVYTAPLVAPLQPAST